MIDTCPSRRFEIRATISPKGLSSVTIVNRYNDIFLSDFSIKRICRLLESQMNKAEAPNTTRQYVPSGLLAKSAEAYRMSFQKVLYWRMYI